MRRFWPDHELRFKECVSDSNHLDIKPEEKGNTIVKESTLMPGMYGSSTDRGRRGNHRYWFIILGIERLSGLKERNLETGDWGGRRDEGPWSGWADLEENFV